MTRYYKKMDELKEEHETENKHLNGLIGDRDQSIKVLKRVISE
jgi:hypothetical protein